MLGYNQIDVGRMVNEYRFRSAVIKEAFSEGTFFPLTADEAMACHFHGLTREQAMERFIAANIRPGTVAHRAAIRCIAQFFPAQTNNSAAS